MHQLRKLCAIIVAIAIVTLVGCTQITEPIKEAKSTNDSVSRVVDTQVSTETPTALPTEEPTEIPTETLTEAPTEEATEPATEIITEEVNKKEDTIVEDSVYYYEETDSEDESSEVSYEWNGNVLTPSAGRIVGPSGEETYYNLPMDEVLSIMYSLGFEGDYWIREDGVKMFGDYVMCAANLKLRPKGTLIETSLGMGIVCDTGRFAYDNPYQLDIAVDW